MDNNENLIEEFTFLDKEGVKFIANEILNTQNSLNDVRNQVNNIHIDIPDTGIIYNSNMDSIAEGIQGNYEQNSAEGQRSHAEGIATYARSEASHTEGYHTETYNAYEHAQGSYNISHSGSEETNTIHSIGIGTDNDNRKNAIELTQNGDLYIYGIGGYQGTDTKVQDSNIMTLQKCISDIHDDMTNVLQNVEATTDSSYLVVETIKNGQTAIVTANITTATLADASNGSTGLAIAQDVYKELSDIEEVTATSITTMSDSLGLGGSLNPNWSQGSGINEASTYREVIEDLHGQVGDVVNTVTGETAITGADTTFVYVASNPTSGSVSLTSGVVLAANDYGSTTATGLTTDAYVQDLLSWEIIE